MSVRVFPERFNSEGKTHLSMTDIILCIDYDLRLNRREKEEAPV